MPNSPRFFTHRNRRDYQPDIVDLAAKSVNERGRIALLVDVPGDSETLVSVAKVGQGMSS